MSWVAKDSGPDSWLLPLGFHCWMNVLFVRTHAAVCHSCSLVVVGPLPSNLIHIPPILYMLFNSTYIVLYIWDILNLLNYKIYNYVKLIRGIYIIHSNISNKLIYSKLKRKKIKIMCRLKSLKHSYYFLYLYTHNTYCV